MFKNIFAAACLVLGVASTAQATVIGANDFVAPTIIDFENAASGALGSQYAAQGVTFVNFARDVYATSSQPPSRVALSFIDGSPNLKGELLFSSSVTRVGFDATTNPEDDTTLLAYLGNTLVGSALFDTGGDGNDGSFLGIELLTGFDRLVLQTGTGVNGAIAIDNLRFENAPDNDVPEPAALSLLGVAVLGMAAARRRRRAA